MNITAVGFNRNRDLPAASHVKDFLVSRSDDSFVRQLSIEHEQRLYDMKISGKLAQYYAVNTTHKSGIAELITDVYHTLRAIHFYTISDLLVKCFTVRQGCTIVDAASRMDINISRNLIRGDVVAFDDFYRYKADKLKLLMDAKLRGEGKRYILNDGDILEFHYHQFNVKYDFEED